MSCRNDIPAQVRLIEAKFVDPPLAADEILQKSA
jgi:hypothetical protein